MYRRVVSLLLLPCVLLIQSAGLGHAHGESQPAGHDLRPHVHTNPTPAGHTHEHGHHHHGPGGHHHHHHHDDGDDAPQPTPQREPLSDHDSDALYLDSVDVIVNECSVVDDDAAASAFWSIAALSGFAHSWANPSHEFAKWTHPPPSGCSCPLYVRHLTLLI